MNSHYSATVHDNKLQLLTESNYLQKQATKRIKPCIRSLSKNSKSKSTTDTKRQKRRN